uniref:Uncharacterized protein n=1 Tax=Tetradesmus obliquus TaxID=3088 RepID=A0A383VR95_TETOB|eukprot:jgi/Sobl393_1/689/SZX67369.1
MQATASVSLSRGPARATRQGRTGGGRHWGCRGKGRASGGCRGCRGREAEAAEAEAEAAEAEAAEAEAAEAEAAEAEAAEAEAGPPDAGAAEAEPAGDADAGLLLDVDNEADAATAGGLDESEADETMLKSLVAAWERSKKPGGNAGAGQAAADVQVDYGRLLWHVGRMLREDETLPACRKAKKQLLNSVSAVLTKEGRYGVEVKCTKHNNKPEVEVHLNTAGTAAAGAGDVLKHWGGGPSAAAVRNALTGFAARLRGLGTSARQGDVDELVAHIDKLLCAQ